MSDFLEALAPVLAWEGGYANDPNDRGGETYKGVSRKNWPHWVGWTIVDKIKQEASGESKETLNKRLEISTELQEAVTAFYKRNFWNVLGIDTFPQILANEIFEQAVNMGSGRAIIHLQKFCNSANYDPKTGNPYVLELAQDGINGAKTKQLVKLLLKKRFEEKEIVHALRCLQGAFYIELALQNKKQRKFIKGWLSRA